MKVLAIENHSDVIDSITLSFLLEWEDVDLFAVKEGSGALSIIEKESPEVIILDTNLPGEDIFETIRKIRSITEIPLIILTENGDEQEITKCLDSGADDFVTKPFTRVELLTRVKRWLSIQSLNHEEKSISYGDLRYEAGSGRFLYKDKELTLTPTEADILHLIMKEAGGVLKHTELTKAIWNDDSSKLANTLKVHIHNIRRKLKAFGKDSEYVSITNWPGLGYSLELQKDNL